MTDYFTITGAVYAPDDDETVLTVSGGGLTPSAHIARVVSYIDGSPERDRVATTNDATTITVRGDASGESGTHVQVQDSPLRENEYRMRASRLEALRHWARGSLTPAAGQKSAPYGDIVTDASYDAEKDVTTLTLTTGGLTVNAEVRRCARFTDGAPERGWLVVANAAGTLVVRGDATGESGTYVTVEEMEWCIGALTFSADQVGHLRAWAAANL